MIDREILEDFSPYKYVAELFRDGFVVRQTGRAGKLVYSEGWRHARFSFELTSDGVSVDLRSARWWLLPFGLPLMPLTDRARTKVLARLQSRGRYVTFERSMTPDEIANLLPRS